ncbi:MAG: polyphosphate polymerase domain-containing protein [Prolixibacteraceae bacterium]|nr:polyphosphate polymerase domain-containing protein [Prolixibacteraceae bacterium]
MNLLMQHDGMDLPGTKGVLDWPLQLTQMESISLGSMEGVRLMHRSDTKFVMPAELLPEVLESVKEHYFILEIGGRRIATYETVYYDWPQGRFFLDHVNGKLNRHKVRVRTYLESRLRFLEVKRKTNTGKTIKLRMGLEEGTAALNEEGLAFLSGTLYGDVRQLQAIMVNRFRRITLVNREMTERVTIDVDLGYSDMAGSKMTVLPGLVIVEVKQERFSASVMKSALKEMRVKARGISKYCLGITLLGLSAKTNNYKRKIRIIQKITHNGITA